MPQLYKCTCGHTLYNSNTSTPFKGVSGDPEKIVDPSKIIERHNGRCPNCGKKLVFKRKNVKVTLPWLVTFTFNGGTTHKTKNMTNWRQRLETSPSNAEMAIALELQKRHLTTHMFTQYPFIFNLKEDLVAGTFADFYWSHPHDYAVFIDGKHIHLKDRQSRRDRAVDKALRRRGVRVDRFCYKCPLRKARLKEIVDRVESVLRTWQLKWCCFRFFHINAHVL